VVVQIQNRKLGIVVDQVRGREEVVVKPLPHSLRGLTGLAAATITGDGNLALILDVAGLRNAL
jgi:two-component system chemotaxis sensor kinase CheA